jgi:hypothetical protein
MVDDVMLLSCVLYSVTVRNFSSASLLLIYERLHFLKEL